MGQIKIMVYARSAECYELAYNQFNEISNENDLNLDNGDSLADYFYFYEIGIVHRRIGYIIID